MQQKNNPPTVKIDTRKLIYYSQLDEDHFFRWAQEISCVASVEEGILHVEPDNVDESNLRDLIALLYRYQLPMRQLKAFLSSENEHWFRSESAYWYEGVFGHR